MLLMQQQVQREKMGKSGLSGAQATGASYELCCMQVANAVFMMPRDTHDNNPVIQAMLQGLSWCERHRQADLASRNAYLTSQGKVHLPSLHLALSLIFTVQAWPLTQEIACLAFRLQLEAVNSLCHTLGSNPCCV